jgi:hypothetical protein
VQLLKLDKTRLFVYGILTDLHNFCLVKVMRVASDNPDTFSVELQRTELLRYEAGNPCCGFHIMASLTSMPPKKLGMWPLVGKLNEFRVTQYLGSGHEASVYRVEALEGKVSTALRLLRHDLHNPGAAQRTAEETAEPPAGSSQFENERRVLADLAMYDWKLPRISGDTDGEDGAALTPVPDTSPAPWLNALEHVPAVLPSQEEFVFHISPEGQRLTSANIRAVYLDQLMYFLCWLHNDVQRFHRDLSYNNLLVAPKGWRKLPSEHDDDKCCSPSEYDDDKCCLPLIDWEFSIPREQSSKDDAFKGTALTMSQHQLEAVMRFLVSQLATDSGAQHTESVSFEYTVQDELEAAVKSVLLVLSHSLKRRLKQEAIKNSAEETRVASMLRLKSGSARQRRLQRKRHLFQHVYDVWDRVLPSIGTVIRLCKAHDYAGLATYLKTELIHFDPKEE